MPLPATPGCAGLGPPVKRSGLGMGPRREPDGVVEGCVALRLGGRAGVVRGAAIEKPPSKRAGEGAMRPADDGPRPAYMWCGDVVCCGEIEL